MSIETFLDTRPTIHTAPGVNFESFTLDDSTDRQLIGYSGNLEYCRAFIPNVNGTLSVLTVDDQIVGIPVLAGIPYSLIAKRFRSTGSTGVTAVIGIV